VYCDGKKPLSWYSRDANFTGFILRLTITVGRQSADELLVVEGDVDENSLAETDLTRNGA